MTNITHIDSSKTPFDSIRQIDEAGNEYWLARDLMVLLGYATWQKFNDTIKRAIISCQVAGNLAPDHFLAMPYHAEGKGRPGKDYKLSRYAISLIQQQSGKSTIITKQEGGEGKVQDKLAKDLAPCQTEVQTLAGRIDILTSTQVIEVKHLRKWKYALGQVLVYGSYYPSHQKRIHLFGGVQGEYLDMICKHCKRFKVVVTWEV